MVYTERTAERTDEAMAAREGTDTHVVFLNWRDQWHPEGGGSETYLRQVAERLAASGHRVTTFTARYPGSRAEETVEGVRYVRRGLHLSVYLWAALYLATGRLGRVDSVVEVQNGMPFLARLFTRARVVVLVHHVHREQWPVVGKVLARIGWFMESRVAPLVNRRAPYVAVSQITAAELVELGVDASHIRVAYNGMPPVPEFVTPPKDEHPSLVALSRLVPHKQLEHALRTLHELRDEIPDATLTIMGSGWWHDELTAMTAELGLVDRVRFLGHVDDSVKFAELSRAWVHLLPSLKEGWGLSIVEAAHVGVPSIAYRSAGGVQESILDGVTGLLAQDEDDFTHCTRRLLQDHELRQSMGTKARLRSEQFTWEATTAVVESCLHDRATVGATSAR